MGQALEQWVAHGAVRDGDRSETGETYDGEQGKGRCSTGQEPDSEGKADATVCALGLFGSGGGRECAHTLTLRYRRTVRNVRFGHGWVIYQCSTRICRDSVLNSVSEPAPSNHVRF
ncbi:hypothetical protein GCM10010448_27910 [Streptomyces glomeratus]|uniref:Uncharacterized protein n=1 Tax=Streptomyces glomeratus TaxID=284452 RepID=A0ABP6LHQ8_9ACTN